jgi:two-component system sensor histidine kinase/response regulator
VATAYDGSQAVAAWEEGQFDVILMDVQMPGMDGLEATRRIRRHEQGRALRPTPIIALTASVLDQNRVATQDAGMDGFASKPIELADLFAEIARVIGISLPAPEGATVQEIRRAPSLTAIDWTRGVTLWGSTHTLGEAIRRLLTDHIDVCSQLERHLRSRDLDAARQQVHRLRGAAGNLCLVTLHALTTEMEDNIRAQEIALALDGLPRLGTAMEDIWDALGLLAEPINAPVALHPLDQPPALLQSSNFSSLSGAVIESLRHGEMNDAGLAQLTHALRAAGRITPAQDIENAINAFEFKRAEELILELLDSLAEHAQSGPL